MRLLLKVTGANKLTDDKLLVQLQGKFGNAQLNLPIHQQKFVQVGDEWTLGCGKAIPDRADRRPKDRQRSEQCRRETDGIGASRQRKDCSPPESGALLVMP